MINLKYLTKGSKIKEIKTNKQGIIYVRFITCILKKVVLMNNSQKLVSLLKYLVSSHSYLQKFRLPFPQSTHSEHSWSDLFYKESIQTVFKFVETQPKFRDRRLNTRQQDNRITHLPTKLTVANLTGTLGRYDCVIVLTGGGIVGNAGM